MVLAAGAILALAAVSPARAQGRQVLVDDLGRKIVLPHGARRIIALSPTAAEILYAVGAQSKLVAVGTRCDYPPQAHALPQVDGLNPSLEMLVALRPDLIVTTDQLMTVATADQLAVKYHAPVFVTAAASYQQAETDIMRLGAYFGSPSLAKATVDRMASTLADVRRRVAGRRKPRVFVVIWENPLMTAGRGSYYENLIDLAGGVNVAHWTTGYGEYPAERLVIDNPDLILIQTEGGDQQLAMLRPLRLRAVKAGHVYKVFDDWVDRPGPRLALGLVSIARFLHPEAYPTPARPGG